MTSESNQNDFAHEVGLSREEINKRYTESAQHETMAYEKILRDELYKGPQIAAEAVAQLYPDVGSRTNLKILDIAAGTGFVAQKLKEKGFSEMDALEPSEGMAKLAREKGLYKHIYLECLSSDPTQMGKDYYDVAVSSGGMGEGHIPCSGLDEMIRVVKPGGYVVIVMRKNYLETVEEYKDRLEPRMKELSTAGFWEPVSRTVVPRYSYENDGVVFVFRLLGNST